MSFSAPLGLLLIILLLPVIYFGWPRQRFRRARDIASLFLRVTILALLILALAGAQLVRGADRLAVVYLLDLSDSMGASAREAARQYIVDSLATMGPDDEAGLIVFGEDSLLEQPLSNVRQLRAILSTPRSGNTNIEEAVRLALGLLPAEAGRRIIILSDGQSTLGNSESAAELAAATGVEISYVQFSTDPGPEVLVTRFDAPAAVNAGQDFDLSISVEAEAATSATLTVFAAGQIIQRQEVNLQAGSNNFVLPLRGSGSGFRDFEVRVDPAGGDNFFQNNQLSTFSRVIGPPRLLLVTPNLEEIANLRPALEQSGLSVDVTRPEDLPIDLVPLAQYDTVVLANVPATRLTPRRMEVLQGYVRDLGGGLVTVGGPDAYGPGGYFATPLEEALPLESQIRDQQRIPQLTIAYVIDRSGSMGAVGPSGVENLELAKEAIIRSVDFLQPTDRAGVVSFDSEGYWIANIQQVRDRLNLQRLVATLRTGGGTDILAGMNLVSTDIVNDPSQRKHIILLTDGGADPTGLIELSRQLYQNYDISTSVIAIGAGGTSFLADMARQGGGNYHPVDIVEQIPTIFTLETVLATRSYIFEEPFVPALSSSSPILNGITTAPDLLGYVATSPKQTAEVILRGPEPFRDPLLATWQYGLGRSVAFTSDAASRWAANWVTWDNFVRFWGQAVRWTITEGADANLESRVVMEGETARLIVDARDDSGNFLNGLNLQFSLVDPQRQASLLSLRQVAPGRYEATFRPGEEGSYLLRVTGSSGDGAIRYDQTAGWVMSYSAEYGTGNQGDGAALLTELASLTGGRSLADDPAGVFAHNLIAQPVATPVWPWLLLAAMLLLPLDIAVRRLVITRSDWVRLRRWIFNRGGAEATSERLSTLIGAKARARERAEAETGGTVVITPTEAISTTDSPSVSVPKQPIPTVPDGNVAGQLLKRRKERSGDSENN
jgi:uncharacterized membrane protein